MSCVAETTATAKSAATMPSAGTPKKNAAASAPSSSAPAACVPKIHARLRPTLSTSGLQSAFSVHGRYAHAATVVMTALSKPRSFIATGATRSTTAFGSPCVK